MGALKEWGRECGTSFSCLLLDIKISTGRRTWFGESLGLLCSILGSLGTLFKERLGEGVYTRHHPVRAEEGGGRRASLDPQLHPCPES